VEIQDWSSEVSSRVCDEDAVAGLDVSGGFMDPAEGLRRPAFLVGKSLRRRDGTPAVTVHSEDICCVIASGKLVVLGRTRRRSQ